MKMDNFIGQYTQYNNNKSSASFPVFLEEVSVCQERYITIWGGGFLETYIIYKTAVEFRHSMCLFIIRILTFRELKIMEFVLSSPDFQIKLSNLSVHNIVWFQYQCMNVTILYLKD